MKPKLEEIQLEWVKKTTSLMKLMAERIVELEDRVSKLENVINL
jgi:hypothetical protein